LYLVETLLLAHPGYYLNERKVRGIDRFAHFTMTYN